MNHTVRKARKQLKWRGPDGKKVPKPSALGPPQNQDLESPSDASHPAARFLAWAAVFVIAIVGSALSIGNSIAVSPPPAQDDVGGVTFLTNLSYGGKIELTIAAVEESNGHPTIVIEPTFSGTMGQRVRFSVVFSGRWAGAKLSNDVDNFAGIQTTRTAQDVMFTANTEIGAPKTVGPLAIEGSIHGGGVDCPCAGPVETIAYTPPVMFFALPHPIVRSSGNTLVIDTPTFGDTTTQTPSGDADTFANVDVVSFNLGRAIRNVAFTTMVPKSSSDQPLTWTSGKIQPISSDVSSPATSPASLRVTAVGTMLDQQNIQALWTFISGVLVTLAFAASPGVLRNGRNWKRMRARRRLRGTPDP